jgi:hypothetical protein
MTAELDTLRKTVRDFCDREIRPTAQERDRARPTPRSCCRGSRSSASSGR